jgi:sugar phosphate isomerase/epimerase
MSRPVAVFSGQWADLPFGEFCGKVKSFGYDGIEIAGWGSFGFFIEDPGIAGK